MSFRPQGENLCAMHPNCAGGKVRRRSFLPAVEMTWLLGRKWGAGISFIQKNVQPFNPYCVRALLINTSFTSAGLFIVV